MRLSPPVPWRDVPRGAIVLYGLPRRVLVNDPWQMQRTVLLENMPAIYPRALDTVQLVLLDEADAIATLTEAGLNPEPLD